MSFERRPVKTGRSLDVTVQPNGVDGVRSVLEEAHLKQRRDIACHGLAGGEFAINVSTTRAGTELGVPCLDGVLGRPGTPDTASVASRAAEAVSSSETLEIPMSIAGQGIEKRKGETQPADKDRAQTAHGTSADKSPSHEGTRDPKLADHPTKSGSS